MQSLRTIFALSIALTMVQPATAGAESIFELRVRIEVDVSALPPEDRTTQYTRQWVLERQTTVLNHAGFSVDDDADNVVRIEISRDGDYGVHTKARLMVVGHDPSLREFTCEACTDSQFLAQVEEQTTQLAEWLRRDRAQAPALPANESAPAVVREPKPAEPAEVEVDHGEPVASEEPLGRKGERFGGLGFAGIASLALGVGVTVGGVIVWAEDPTLRIPPEDTLVEEKRTRRRLGTAMMGGGGAAIATSIVWLVIDHTVLRKRRSQAKFATSLQPTGSATGFGASLNGRF